MPREAGCGETVRGEEAPRTHLVLTFPWVQGGRLCAGRVGGSAAGKLDLLGEQGWRWAPRSALWGNLQGT